MAEIDRETPAARCPRCGYDQRGTTETWREACPITGTCTECGLEFEWAELLSPSLAVPLWCVESRFPGRWFIVRSAVTHLASLSPGWFWGKIRMSHPLAWKQLRQHLVLTIVPIYLLFCILVGWSHWRAVNDHVSWALRNGGTFTGSPVHESLRASALPFSSSSSVSATIPGTRGMGPPLALRIAVPMESAEAVLQVMLPWMVAYLAVQVAVAVAFVCLPIARRRAKVHWHHILRVSSYGAATVLPASLMLCVLALLVGRRSMELHDGHPLLVGAVAVWIFSWWGCGVSRYMRMNLPWGVAAAVLVLGVLAIAAARSVLSLRPAYMPGGPEVFLPLLVTLSAVVVLLALLLRKRIRASEAPPQSNDMSTE